METGIFTLLGVILGALLTKKDIKLSFFKKGGKTELKEEENSIIKQWENLLNYDGGVK